MKVNTTPIPLIVISFSILALVLAAGVSLYLLDGIPHVSDEVVYLLQSKLFANGLRFGPEGDNAGMLLFPFLEVTPRYFGAFPAGWPALLSLGTYTGVPWLVNPLIGATLPILTWLLAREFVTPKVAVLSSAVMALSPGVLVLSGSHMSQTSVLSALLFTTVIVARNRDSWPLWALAGVALGYVENARPFDAIILGAPLFILAFLANKKRGQGLINFAVFAIPVIAGGALLLYDNQLTTGSPFQFPINHWFDSWVADMPAAMGCNNLGFGDDIGCFETFGSLGHTPAKALQIAADTVVRLDSLVLGTPFALALAIIGLATIRGTPLLLSVAIILLCIGGYSLYWSPGIAYGARLWHNIYIVLPILVALGFEWIRAKANLHEATPWLILIIMVGFGAPSRLSSLGDDYWCVNGGLGELLDSHQIEEGIVFLQGGQREQTGWPELGIEEFTCDPLISASNGFYLDDPKGESLLIRHALPDLEQTRAYLSALHPGFDAWLIQNPLHSSATQLYRLTDNGWELTK